MSQLLEIDDITVGYTNSAVVRNVSLHVEEGEVVALLGPNGAGKTTTLLSAAALLSPMSGEIRLFGRSIARQRPHHLAQQGMAFVPEDRAIFFSLTVRENLRLAARSNDIDDVFRWFPALEPLLGRRAGLLSGGEQQMLSVGRALLMKPRLLVVDEMSLGLAPVIVQNLLPVLPEIATESGCGVLLVEQHVHLALKTASRAYVLAHGDLVLSGQAEDLIEDRALLESSYLGTASTPS